MATSDGPNNEPIWDLPGLSKHEFYAAAYFLSHQQRQQGGDEYSPEETRTPAALRTLLDALALLFARAKGANTAANVTAVAVEVRNTDEGRRLVFYVAKNGGPQSIKERSDEDFADALATWYNTADDEVRVPQPSSEMWQKMVLFWEQRIQTYLRTIAGSRTLVETKGEVEEQFRDTGVIDFDAFRRDFDTLLQFADAGDRADAQHELLFDMCFQLPDVSDHKYPKFRAPPRGEKDTRSAGQKNAEKFRKAVKHIKLLRTLRVVWEQFVALRDQHGDSVVSILFEPRWDLVPLQMEPIVSTMKSWKAPPTGKHAFAQDIATVVRSLSHQGAVRNLFFHCELQLLERCITAPQPGNFQDYFGCSKLSCALCWRVMKNADYQTKGTHARLYPDCAFPFGVSSADGHCRLGVALKRAQDQLLERILRYCMHPDDRLTQYVPRTETNPYAVTIPAEVDFDNRFLDWLSSEPEATEAVKVQVPVLRISADGELSVKKMTLYDIRNRQPGSDFTDAEEQRVAWRPGNDKTRDQLWATTFQIRQYGYTSKTARFYTPSAHQRWQWANFRITLDESAHLYAEIQILFRLTGYRRPFINLLANSDNAYLPVNAFCEQVVGLSLPRTGRYPWRGDLYIAGQVVSDDGTFTHPHVVRSVNEETKDEFLDLFREVVGWTSWYEVTHKRRLWDKVMDKLGPGIGRREFTLSDRRPVPSAEEMEKWWAPTLQQQIFRPPVLATFREV